MLVKAGLLVQYDHSAAHPGQAEASTNCGIIVAPNKLPWDHSKAASDIGLHQKKPRTNALSSQLEITSKLDLIGFISGIARGRHQQAPNPAEANSTTAVSMP